MIYYIPHGNIKENESDLDLGLQKDYMLKKVQ